MEETFQPVPSSPSEILRGLDAGRLPNLLGYNATTAKGTATVALLTARDDPLLAQWQYGLGRAVAWTSDARQQWASPWIGTTAFGTLTAQLVAWTLPPQDEQGIDVRFSPGRDGELHVEVTSLTDDGTPRNFYRTVLRLVGPDLGAAADRADPGRPGPLRRDGARRSAGCLPRARGADAGGCRLRQSHHGRRVAGRGGVSTPGRGRRCAGALRRRRPGAGDPARPGRHRSWSSRSGATTSEAAAFPTPIWPLAAPAGHDPGADRRRGPTRGADSRRLCEGPRLGRPPAGPGASEAGGRARPGRAAGRQGEERAAGGPRPAAARDGGGNEGESLYHGLDGNPCPAALRGCRRRPTDRPSPRPRRPRHSPSAWPAAAEAASRSSPPPADESAPGSRRPRAN